MFFERRSTGPINNQRRRRMGWRKRNRGHHPMVPIVCQILNLHTSYALCQCGNLPLSATLSLYLFYLLFVHVAFKMHALHYLFSSSVYISFLISFFLLLSWPCTTLIWLLLKLSHHHPIFFSLFFPSALSSIWRQRGKGDRLSRCDWSGKTTPSTLAYCPEWMCDIRLVHYPTQE